jgi:hypothetical protein
MILIYPGLTFFYVKPEFNILVISHFLLVNHSLFLKLNDLSQINLGN